MPRPTVDAPSLPLLIRPRRDGDALPEALTRPSRLDALARSGLLSSAFEDRYDRFVRLASRMLGVPTSLVSLVEPHRQFFKSLIGLEGPAAEARETPLSHSFCQHVVTGDGPLMVEDARADPRVCDNGAVRDLGVVAYLGAPIRSADGEVLGSLCAIDGAPRAWSEDDVAALVELAEVLSVEIALDEAARRLVEEERARADEAEAARAARDELERESALLQTTLSNAPVILYAFDADGRVTVSRGAGLRTLGLAEGEAVGTNVRDFSEPGSASIAGTRRVLGGEPASWTQDYGGEVFQTRAVPTAGGGAVALATVVTDRVRAEEDAKAQRRRLRKLLAATAVQGTFADRAGAVLTEMSETLGLDAGLLADVRGGTYTCLASVAAEGEPLAPGTTLPLGETYCDLAVALGDLVAIEHMAASAHRAHPCYQAVGLEAYIGVPVFVDGEAVGALSFSSERPAARPFTEADHDLVRLAGQWAGALLEREARERTVAAHAGRLRALADAFAVAAAEDLSGLPDLLDRLRALLALDVAIVSEIDPPADHYRVVACAVPEGAPLAAGDEFEFSCTYCHITYEANDVWDVVEMEASDKSGHPCYEAFGLETYIGAPVHVDGVRFGTLNFSSATARAEPFTESDRELVRLAARWVGGLMERSAAVARRAEAERRATEREALYRLLAENATDIVALHAPDGAFEWVSPSVEALVGYDPDALVGEDFFAFVHPDDVGPLRSLVGPLLAAPATAQTEIRVRHAGGHYLWIESLVRSLAGPDGRVDRLQVASRDVTGRRAMEDRLYHQAHHDELTGLPNRALFTARLDGAVAAGDDYAVLFVDLDRFKAVNDTLGHSAGDELLQVVAKRLTAAVREVDTVARLGGDEFAVLLEPLPEPGFPEAVAQRILEALAADVGIGDRTVSVGASVGVVTGRPDHADSDAVLAEADLAMYRAKASGRGTAAVYSVGAFGPASQRLRLEVDLPRAADRGELRLAYQPLVRLGDGALAGFEALVRWEHPERGLLIPGEFIEAAEDSGAVAAIDLWVLHEAARQRTEWAGRYPDREAPMMTVNCTVRDLLDAGYTAAVERALAAGDGAPGWLVLEITEGMLVEDPETVARELRRLQALGARFALDDFGTGYASLATLHALPVDTVKVDRSFVAAMGGRDESRTLVETVVGLGRLLGRSVVAEGVERAADVTSLRALGCAYGQGYLFAQPLAAAEAEQLLAAGAPPWHGLWAA